MQFYDKRKKGRAFEVNQLRDVMDILSGSSIATRTGLMQDSDAEAAFVQQDDGALDGAQEPAVTERNLESALEPAESNAPESDA